MFLVRHQRFKFWVKISNTKGKRAMDKTKKRAKVLLCVSIVLMLISMVVSSTLQTGGGDVTIKELFWETEFGVGISANLFIPKTASDENPAPAVVTSHGAYNNKEMQDANSIELSRRGYVVLAIDQVNHGKSDLAGTNGIAIPRNSGVYFGALMLSRLPYVDASRIGVTGHSMGGMSCTSAVVMDNENETPIISSVLLNSADATYTDTTSTTLSDNTAGAFANIYRNRDVGIIACVYDEFFHKSTDAQGNSLSSPYYMEGQNAQSFLHFGTDPATLEERTPDTIYYSMVDGKNAARVIYRPPIIHPWSHFSARSTQYTVDFFEATLGAPNPIASTSQVWNIKEAFNFVGLIGLGLFIVNFMILMLFTPFFSSLRAQDIVQPVEINKEGKLWFWGTLAAGAIFAVVVYLPIVFRGVSATYVPQKPPYGISLWAAACGLFAILCMVLSYQLYGKKNKVNLEQAGVKITLPKLGKTMLLAVIVVIVSYSCVFFADYFFHTDFRIWVLALKSFKPNLLFVSLFPYMPLFLVFYVASSVATNCFNYNNIGGKRGWVNTAVVALFTGAPAIFMLVVQYGTYFVTNHMAWMQTSFSGGNPPMYVLWLFPMLVILPVSAIISRVVYKVTRNPYLAGIVNGIIVAILSCTNTNTTFP